MIVSLRFCGHPALAGSAALSLRDQLIARLSLPVRRRRTGQIDTPFGLSAEILAAPMGGPEGAGWRREYADFATL